MAPLTPDDLITQNREVQRKYGCAVLRLQQYEHLLKVFIAEREIGGPASKLAHLQSTRREETAKKTLGMIVGDLSQECLTPALPGAEDDGDDEAHANLTEPWFRFSFKIEMAEDDFARTQERLCNLVALRNELVHHFLQRFDISTIPGCQAADIYLDHCLAEIDANVQQLQEWIRSVAEARSHMAGFMQTPEFYDFLVHGILPGGGGVIWATSTIVRLLREAEQHYRQDDWTPLASAIEFIRAREPMHTPKRYGCPSWRAVLHESKHFEIRREQAAPGAATETWYRSRPG